MDDRTRALKLLQHRSSPPTVLGLLLKTARWKVPIGAVFFGAVAFLYVHGFPIFAAAAAGIWLGAFARDVRTAWTVAHGWRFTEAILDWDKVERIAGGMA